MLQKTKKKYLTLVLSPRRPGSRRWSRWTTREVRQQRTVCPRSLDPCYILTCYMKWTSWTYSSQNHDAEIKMQISRKWYREKVERIMEKIVSITKFEISWIICKIYLEDVFFLIFYHDFGRFHGRFVVNSMFIKICRYCMSRK